MKKVLHLITGLESGGGAENMLLKTLPYLSRTQNGVCVLKGRGEIGSKLEEQGVKVYYLEMKHIFDFGIIARYRKVIKDFAPDIQINYLVHADIFGRIFAKIFGVKYLVSYIRNRHIKPLFVLWDKFTLSRIDYLLANSESVLDYYRDEYNFSKNKSRCISNGINIAQDNIELNVNEFKKELGIAQDNFVITAIASLSPQKNHKILLRAFHNLKIIKTKNIKLVLVGDGPEKDRLVKMAKDLKIFDDVIFLGKRNDVDRVLKISDCFILPSLHEGMSNALLEAMGSSLPCIVSAIPENTELIEHHVNGLVFNTEDSEALASDILFIKNNQDKARKFGLAARQKIVEKYNIENIRQELDDFLAGNYTGKKKIIWVTNSPNDIYFNLFEELGALRPDLELIIVLGASDKNDDILRRYKNFKIKNLDRGGKIFFKIILFYRFFKKSKTNIPNISFLKGLKKFIKDEKPDLLMSNIYFNPSTWQSYLLAKQMKIPFILMTEKRKFGKTKFDKILTRYSFFFLSPLFAYAKYIFCWTTVGFEFAVKHFPVKQKDKIKLFSPGIDTNIFFRQKEVVGQLGKLKLLMVARFVNFKRHKDVIRALKYLNDSTKIDFELNLLGGANDDNPLLDEIKSMIDKFDLEHKVNFIDKYPYDKMNELYSANDVHILASDNEPIGMVVPESMACGLPNIVSDSSGAKTYIKDGVNGYIFKTFDYRDLAEKIKLLADRSRRDIFSKRAEESIRKEFDIKLVANNFFNLIKDIL